MITADQLVAHAIGDYVLQSDWMATKKRSSNVAALAHAFTYTLCFIPFWTRGPLPVSLFVIFITHFYIDRFGLARYVVWAKNFLAPPWIAIEPVAAAATAYYAAGGRHTPSMEDRRKELPVRNLPFTWCAGTGYPPDRPAWLAVWLLINADNVLHVVINGLALRFL